MPVTPPDPAPARTRPGQARRPGPRAGWGPDRRSGTGAGRLGLAAALGVLILLGAGSEPAQASEARFAVTGEVINPDLPAISATIVGRGLANGSRFVAGGGFEPAIFRNAFLVTEDAPDRVIAEPSTISGWDSWREGAFDGADIDIWRIENGVFRLVRSDRVAAGGFHASGWNPMPTGRRIVPGDVTRAELIWEPWYRPDADTWFMVRAMAADGTLSPPSEAVQASSGDPEQRRGKNEDAPGFIRFEVRPKEGSGGPAAPRDVRVIQGPDGRPHLSWFPSAGGPRPAGYVIYRSQTPPERHSGYFFALEGATGKTGVRAGDLAMLRKTFLEISREGFETDRIWEAGGAEQLRSRAVRFWPEELPDVDWRLRPHAADTPVEDAGQTYLELKVGWGKTAQLDGGGFSGTHQSFYEVLRVQPYRVEAWIRSEGPGRVSFHLVGPNDLTKTQRPIFFESGPTWRKVSTEFTPSHVLTEGMGSLRLQFDGPGVFSVDNFRIYRADAPYLDLLPEDYARLREARLSALRTHALVRTGEETYDLAQLTGAGGLAGGTQGGGTLPQQLGIAARAEVDPWLQIEPHLTTEEWTGLVEYLAAPAVAGPWAAKRARQGREAPWTDAFGRIYLELGNETWNQIFSPWIFHGMTDAVTGEGYKPGEVYGMFQEQVIATLRASPWWAKARLDDKVTFVLGGWNINAYGTLAAGRSPHSSLVTLAPYIGGWDADQGLPTQEPGVYSDILNWVSQNSLPNARKHMALAKEVLQAGHAPLEVGTYEAGPGYVMKGLKGAKVTKEQAEVQERVMKSQAVGTATLDNFLAQAAVGYRLQNFFAYGEGERWNSHALWQDGGQAYPSWKLIALMNREGLGDMLKVETFATPAIDLPKGRRKEAVDDAPLTAVYATRHGDRLNVFVLSRRIPDYPTQGEDGCTPVEIALPFGSADKVTLHRMAAPYDADNVTADDVKIETLDLPLPGDPSRFALTPETGAQACGLPAAATFLYVFEGVK